MLVKASWETLRPTSDLHAVAASESPAAECKIGSVSDIPMEGRVPGGWPQGALVVLLPPSLSPSSSLLFPSACFVPISMPQRMIDMALRTC